MTLSFFTKSPAARIWKSVTSVSNTSARRGRGRGMGRIVVKDFNKGQKIGFGPKRINFAGLNMPLASQGNINKIQEVGPNPEFKEKLEIVRESLNVYKKFRLAPLDRGWSGRRAPGMRAGPPDPYNEIEFDGFDSTVLMARSLNHMDGNTGRFRKIHALVVTGNKNGLAGFSTASGRDLKSVIKRARNSAGQALVYVPRFDNHTVMHDFFSRYYFTTVFVYRKPKGYGIKAPRVLKAICEAFGITDVHAEVEGNKRNRINATKALFLGLMNQRKYEDMAEEKRLHLVEVREENFNYPTVLASPKSKVKTDTQIKATGENVDFTYFINNGRLKLAPPPQRNPYENLPSYLVHLDKMDFVKNREKTKILLAAKYGDSKVLDVFPEFKSNAHVFKDLSQEASN